MENLAYMETRVGMRTMAGPSRNILRVFSLEDITETYIKCEEHYNQIDNPPTAGKGKGKGKNSGKKKGPNKNIDTENHINRQGVTEHHGVMFMYKKNSKNPGNGSSK